MRHAALARPVGIDREDRTLRVVAVEVAPERDPTILSGNRRQGRSAAHPSQHDERSYHRTDPACGLSQLTFVQTGSAIHL
jgi:hypothetical protein